MYDIAFDMILILRKSVNTFQSYKNY